VGEIKKRGPEREVLIVIHIILKARDMKYDGMVTYYLKIRPPPEFIERKCSTSLETRWASHFLTELMNKKNTKTFRTSTL
jgi:hypothetical protein